MNMKKILAVVAIFGMGLITQAQSDVALPFDGMATTNRGALASLAIRNADGAVVEIWDDANANLDQNYGEPERYVFPFPKPPGSFKALCDAVNDRMFNLKVTDPTKPLRLRVSFTKGNASERYRGYGANPQFQTLLTAENEDTSLVQWKDGLYSLAQGKIPVRLNEWVRMNIPGLVAGKVIHTTPDGYMYSTPLQNINSNGDFDLPVETVGSGTIVAQVIVKAGVETKAISLVSGKEVPLSDVLIDAALVGSEEILTFEGPALSPINVVVNSYRGYGINPALVILGTFCPDGYTCPAQRLQISVRTTEGILPRGFRIVNTKTGESFMSYPEKGSSQITVNIFSGVEYHVVADLPLLGGRVSPNNGSSNGGGKGIIAVGLVEEGVKKEQ